jgi:predicted transcriptional regulator
MNVVRRTLEIDAETDARLQAMAAERGQDISVILAEAVALLDLIPDVEGPDVQEDLRRVLEFERTGEAVLFDDVRAWVDSWGTANELPRPQPRKVR